jgi:hypothetical protein
LAYSDLQVALLEKVVAAGGQYASRAQQMLRDAGHRPPRRRTDVEAVEMSVSELRRDPVLAFALDHLTPVTESQRYFEAKREREERLALLTDSQLMKQRKQWLKALRTPTERAIDRVLKLHRAVKA